jgi:hypothetical protein
MWLSKKKNNKQPKISSKSQLIQIRGKMQKLNSQEKIKNEWFVLPFSSFVAVRSQYSVG